jgi:hypothetical protein
MGYTGIKDFKKMSISPKLFLDGELTNYANIVLRSEMVGSEYYAAVKTLLIKGDVIYGQKIIAVCIKTEMHGSEFLYKLMTEDCIPYMYNCPASVLMLLSKTDCENSIKWRSMQKAKIPNPQPQLFKAEGELF